ncbi:MAG: hypothetical protein NTW87_06020 [Planctomycetota bacterium]|nr:hypothetical protein [Planctomycetota bacterium]
MAFGQQRMHKMGADEAGTTCYQDSSAHCGAIPFKESGTVYTEAARYLSM